MVLKDVRILLLLRESFKKDFLMSLEIFCLLFSEIKIVVFEE